MDCIALTPSAAKPPGKSPWEAPTFRRFLLMATRMRVCASSKKSSWPAQIPDSQTPGHVAQVNAQAEAQVNAQVIFPMASVASEITRKSFCQLAQVIFAGCAGHFAWTRKSFCPKGNASAWDAKRAASHPKAWATLLNGFAAQSPACWRPAAVKNNCRSDL
jgi:hypothetical protein